MSQIHNSERSRVFFADIEGQTKYADHTQLKINLLKDKAGCCLKVEVKIQRGETYKGKMWEEV